VILNKAMSLVVVASALPFRAATVPWSAVWDHRLIVLNLLAGSLVGAWFGATWATRLRAELFYRVIAVLLAGMAVALLLGHRTRPTLLPLLNGTPLVLAGLVAGLAIGAVAALLGVAGGELLIPTLVLLFGADAKLAGSLSLAVSLPTMLVAFARYSQDRSFSVLKANAGFVLTMAGGSLVGAFLGARLLSVAPTQLLLPLLALILVVSAIKTWRHRAPR